MRKRLIPLAILATGAAYSQVGVGTLTPNKSAQLEVTANDKGILIPRVKLTSTADATTITNGNVNSLLVFNTETVADIKPGYYYWYVDKWYRVLSTGDNSGGFTDTNNINSTFVLQGNKLVLTDDKGHAVEVDLSSLKTQETLTVMGYDNASGILTYKDENGNLSNVDLKGSVNKFETLTSISYDQASGILTYKDEKGASSVLNLTQIIKERETLTKLLYNPATGEISYFPENGVEQKYKVGNVSNIVVEPGYTKITYEKPDGSKGEIPLDQIVKANETLTSVNYDAATGKLIYKDEKGVLTEYTIGGIKSIEVDPTDNTRLIYKTLDGNTIPVPLEQKVTTITEHVDANGVVDYYEYTNEVGAVQKIDVKLTSLEYDKATGNLTYKAERGNPTVINLKASQIPFERKPGIDADNVQDAIEKLKATMTSGMPTVGNIKGEGLSPIIKVVDGENSALKNVTLGVNDKSIGAEKLAPGTGNDGKVLKVVGDEVKYSEINAGDVKGGKDLTGGNEISVTKDGTSGDGVGAVLKDVVLGIKNDAITKDKIKNGEVYPEKINSNGSPKGKVLTSNGDGKVLFDDATVSTDKITNPTTALPTNNQVLKWNASTGKWVPATDEDTKYTGSTSVVLNGTSFERAELTGDVTAPQNNNVLTIGAGKVTTDKIADGAVTDKKLSADAVKTVNIVNGAVTNDKLANNSVGTNNIVNGSVTNEKLANDAVKTDNIFNGSVTNEKLANDSVKTDNIFNGAVTNDKLAGNIESTKIKGQDLTTDGKIVIGDNKVNTLANSVLVATKLSIKEGSITGTELADNAVTTDKIKDGEVKTADLGDKVVTSTKIGDGEVKTINLGDNAVTTDKIKDGAVTNGKIGENAVTSDKIKDGNVTPEKLSGNIPANKIVSQALTTDGKIVIGDNKVNTLANSVLVATKLSIKEGSIGNDEITDNSISGGKITDNTLPGSKITDNTITNDKISGVDGSKITDNTLSGSKITDNTVNSDKIENGSIKGEDIANNTITPDKLTGTIPASNIDTKKLITNGQILLNGGTVAVDGVVLKETTLSIAPNSIGNSEIKNDISGDKIVANTLPVDRIKSDAGNAGKVLKVNNDGSVSPADDKDNQKVNKFALEGSKLVLNVENGGEEKSVDLSGLTPNINKAAISSGDGIIAINGGSTVANAVLVASKLSINTNSITGDKIAIGTIESGNIKDGEVKTADLGDKAVTTGKIADGAVTNGKIGENAVTSDKIKDGEVKTADLGDKAVTTGKIADGAVTETQVGKDAITTDKIKDGNVTPEKLSGNIPANKIASQALTTDGKIVIGDNKDTSLANSVLVATKLSIKEGSIGNDEIADNAVNSAKIADGAVTNGKIGENAVTSVKIADEAVTDKKLANDAVKTDKIVNGAVTNEKLANNSVGTVNIVNGSVTNEKLANDAVKTGNIVNGAVTNDKLATDAVKTGNIVNGSVTNEKLAGNIESTKIKGKDLTTDGKIVIGNSTSTESIQKGAVLVATNLSIKEGSIGEKELGKDAVTSNNIKDLSIKGDDIMDGTIPASKLSERANLVAGKGVTFEGNGVGVLLGNLDLTINTNVDNGIKLSNNNKVELGGTLIKETTITTDAGNTLAITGLQNIEATTTSNKLNIADRQTHKMVVEDANGVLKTMKFRKQQFYMPSVVLPTGDVPAGVEGTEKLADGTYTINLYKIYNEQFGNPYASSDASVKLQTFDKEDLNYFVTYYDEDVFESVSINESGVLTYKVKVNSVVSEKTFMNIVFQEK